MSALTPYENILKGWNKKWGAKPTARQLREIQEAGLARTGSKTAFALAMLLREDGASQAQIKEALGATYRNRANELCLRGMARLKRRRASGQTLYRLEVKNFGALRATIQERERHEQHDRAQMHAGHAEA